MTFVPPSPLAPMEAKQVEEIPTGAKWQYEPKWDGFRCILFRDNAKIVLQSKAGKPLTRYFPEVVAAASKMKTKRFVLDGEIVVPHGKAFSFDQLLQRIHPAASRIAKLSAETPALVIVFDLLGVAGQSLVGEFLPGRRGQLEAFAKKNFSPDFCFRLSPSVTALSRAEGWLKKVGATLDGVVAKRRDLPYQSGNREGMVKIKNYRGVDCVVGGFRFNEGEPVVGSLLLGLYDSEGLLHHVGFTSALSDKEKPALTAKLKKLVASPGFTGTAPGGKSRWSTGRSEKWEPLRPELVVEVGYDHFTGGRFRHGTRLLRWRPDKSPGQCTMEQVKQKKANLLSLLK